VEATNTLAKMTYDSDTAAVITSMCVVAADSIYSQYQLLLSCKPPGRVVRYTNIARDITAVEPPPMLMIRVGCVGSKVMHVRQQGLMRGITFHGPLTASVHVRRDGPRSCSAPAIGESGFRGSGNRSGEVIGSRWRMFGTERGRKV
jgi:hypothetical protein